MARSARLLSPRALQRLAGMAEAAHQRGLREARAAKARQASVYRGAAVHRLNATRVPSNLSPTQELRYEGALLRARARQLVRDNGYVAGFVEDTVSQVLGAAGLTLRPQVRDAQGALAKPVNDAIGAAFADWGACETASLDGAQGWVDLQELALRTWIVDGEFFCRKLRYADNPHGFTLQPFDADQVDETYHLPPDANGVEVRMGVEIDRRGRVLAYWVWDRHPSEANRGERRRLPAEEVIHLYTRTRPGQVRGVTWFAPVLSTALQFDELTESELATARVAAGSMGVIVNTSDAAIQAYSDEIASRAEQLAAAASGDATAANAPGGQLLAFEVEPGTLQELAPGQDIKQFSPAHPSPQYAAFAKVILRGQARGLLTSYTSLTGDLEAVNYSSLRHGALRERDGYRIIQRRLGSHFGRPVYLGWLSMALLTGALNLPGAAAEYRLHVWKGRGWDWVDPEKDLRAMGIALELRLTSRRRICDLKGEDWEEILEELEQEAELAAEHGIALPEPSQATLSPSVPEAPARRPPPADDDDTDDTSDDAEGRAAARRLALVGGIA